MIGVGILGSLFHFVYDFTGQNRFVGLFVAINESTWEHMKLLFWPMFVFSVIESLFFKDRKDFWCVKLRSTLLGLVLIPVLFYTYNGVVGKSPDWLNIAIFFVAAAIASLSRSKQMSLEPLPSLFAISSE